MPGSLVLKPGLVSWAHLCPVPGETSTLLPAQCPRNAQMESTFLFPFEPPACSGRAQAWQGRSGFPRPVVLGGRGSLPPTAPGPSGCLTHRRVLRAIEGGRLNSARLSSAGLRQGLRSSPGSQRLRLLLRLRQQLLPSSSPGQAQLLYLKHNIFELFANPSILLHIRGF